MDRLLDKYNQPSPRYTSYPPIPCWGRAGNDDELRTAVKASTEPLSIYFHIPFCRRLCLYCGCNTVITNEAARATRYLESVFSEIDQFEAAHGRRVTQVHWGGGSPTFLSPADAGELADRIRDTFEVGPDAEVSIEIDLRVISLEYLEVLSRFGFNRMSVGV